VGNDLAAANAVPAADAPSGSDAAGKAAVLDEERYAIQLISFRNESSVGPFMERFGIAEEARYIRADGESEDWYAVVLGNFPSRSEAAAAVRELPPRLRELEPWVRPLPAGTELMPLGEPREVDQDT
jgi:septal ring-binding cell division protein DamX